MTLTKLNILCVDPSITLDLRAKLEDIARDLPWAASRRTPKRLNNGFDSLEATPDVSRAGSPAPFAGSANSPLSDQLDIARQWLANLVPFGVDRDCDETLQQLGIVKPSLQLSLASTRYVHASSIGSHQASLTLIESDRADSSTFTSQNLRKSAWTLSPHSTAQRLLLITSVLRVFLNYPSTERSATQAIVHFASCLEDSVGADFECPDLGLLADFWLDKNSKLHYFIFTRGLSRIMRVSFIVVWKQVRFSRLQDLCSELTLLRFRTSIFSSSSRHGKTSVRPTRRRTTVLLSNRFSSSSTGTPNSAS